MTVTFTSPKNFILHCYPSLTVQEVTISRENEDGRNGKLLLGEGYGMGQVGKIVYPYNLLPNHRQENREGIYVHEEIRRAADRCRQLYSYPD